MLDNMTPISHEVTAGAAQTRLPRFVSYHRVLYHVPCKGHWPYPEQTVNKLYTVRSPQNSLLCDVFR